MTSLTVGIIGAGRIGKLHVENLRKIPQIRIKSVSDVVIDHLEAWGKEKQIEVLTNNYHELLEDPDIQAVFICSPTNTHATIIKEAALAGKDIFCEKPVSFSVEETEAALAVVEKAGVKLQIGFNRRYDPNFRRIQTLVKDGQIGQPHILRITSRDPEPPGVDYVKASGGLFMDMMIHDFDMARYVMDSEVVEVSAAGAVLVDPAIGEVGDIDTAIVTLKFANGALGVIDNSRQAVYGYDQRLEVFGEKGAAQADNNRPTTVEVSTVEAVTLDKPLYFFLERYNQAYIDEVLEFTYSILEKKEVACTGFDGLQAQKIAKAAKESLEKGAPVQLNLAAPVI
ncbi:inositol 2-dehydrogenase [Bacillus sp. ISL-40]|uniref:inositol 2-dehydrogenase n=1 Tax=unclassified Bacillus (in: firmicutes) TaxID=185979 RepID=UPI001BE8781E|nr:MULTISPECIES: inositol 2-dehydrogenase [unclassified Bacillus (in: firmicutes)]MBT2701096.1 inositol 2-dehydrogenase [Bacillus sp. ISL-40]MBT2723356.1 inositol 2-dehydrogenase [Bacillus sp. ISL-46]MBT2728684.1 inositol 2-dehydrogenase [Bacillus sp. ISL-75]MBT2741062.1 inositol 2-dehydrogenase [Bacillus sp. ISL-77]